MMSDKEIKENIKNIENQIKIAKVEFGRLPELDYGIPDGDMEQDYQTELSSARSEAEWKITKLEEELYIFKIAQSKEGKEVLKRLEEKGEKLQEQIIGEIKREEEMMNSDKEEEKDMKILNLTQHSATPEQMAQGVVEPRDKKEVQDLLTFNALPEIEELEKRAMELAHIAYVWAYDEFYDENQETPCGADTACKCFTCFTHIIVKHYEVMIGGAPYLMAPLEKKLKEVGLNPVYAFSQRVSIDKENPDGSITKTMVFKHLGFVR